MVAVTIYHTHISVNKLTFPTGIASNATRSIVMIIPILMTLNVSFIHHVQTIIIKHGIHLGLTRIMTGTYRIHIGLLHHRNVLQHGRHIDTTTINGMGILIIHSFKINLLAIYINQLVLDFYLTEAVFSREGHFFLAFLIFLTNYYGIEIRFFSRPKNQIVQLSAQTYMLYRIAILQRNIG